MKRMIILAAAVMYAAAAMAQQPIPADPAVRTGKLENGLTYYIRHNEEPKGQANFYIAQKVGSILEDEHQRGLAHFLEHMCFNGTEHFPGNGVIKYCESIGVKFGENLNAYTSIDETVYNIDNVPVAATPSAVDSCLWILHDWADGLLLTDEDIDHERGVIHEEWRSRMNAANMRLIEKLLPELYPGNRYGERLPIGLMSVVDNFPYNAIREYYEKWYRPDLQGIIVVGDIDVDAVEGKIRDIFGTIATPVDPAERYYVQIEDNAEPIVCMAADKEQMVAMTYIFSKHDDFPKELKSDLNYLVYDYAKTAMGIMLRQRIQEMLQSAEPPFIDANISDGDFFVASTKKAFTGVVASSEDGFAKAVTTLYREMLRAVRGGFTASEYERAKAMILAEVETQYNQRDKRKSASFCQEYVNLFIDNEPAPGIEFEYALMQQIAPAIPVEAVNQIAASMMGEGNLAVVCMLPEKEGVTYPSTDEMKAMLAAVAAEDIEPYTEEVSDEPLIAELPAPGKVVKVKDAKFGYKMYKLSNGAVVYAKSTDLNPDQILMSARSNGGTSIYNAAEATDLKVVDELLGIGGVGSFSKTALNKALAGKKVSLTTSVDLYTESVSGKTTPKDLETLLQLNYLSFTAPRYDEEAFASWKNRERAAIANRDSQPMAAFQDTLSSTIYDNAVRVKPLSIEELEKVDYARAMEIGKQRFADASDFTFIFTGAFDEDTLVPLIEQYIGSLPAAGKKEKADKKVISFSKGAAANSFDRAMEIPMVTSCFFDNAKVKVDYSRKVAFDIALNCLSTVLLEEIREKEGGTYGIGAYGTMSSFPVREAYYQVAYQTDPDRYEYLNQRVREIVDEFAAKGPREEDLAKAKEFNIKQYNEALMENSFWAGAMNSWLVNGEDVVSGFEQMVSSMSAETVRKVFESVWKQGNHAEIIMRGVKAE